MATREHQNQKQTWQLAMGWKQTIAFTTTAGLLESPLFSYLKVRNLVWPADWLTITFTKQHFGLGLREKGREKGRAKEEKSWDCLADPILFTMEDVETLGSHDLEREREIYNKQKREKCGEEWEERFLR